MTTTPDATSADAAIAQLVDALTLEEKVALVTGRDFWNTVPIERIGLRNMLCSDGPSGVRGERWDEREPSLNLPSSTALARRGAVRSPLRRGARRRGPPQGRRHRPRSDHQPAPHAITAVATSSA